MVCVPCIVVPVLLWVFHTFIMPIIRKFWNPSKVEDAKVKGTVTFTEAMLQTDEGKFVKENIDSNPVILFAKTTCTYCKMARKVLDGTGVSYSVENIDGREDMDKLQDLFKDLTGERTVPRVFIGGKCIGGGTQVMELNGEGKLVDIMKEAGATFKDKST